MNDKLQVVESETDIALPEGYDPVHIDIAPHRLAARVYSFGKGDYAVTDIDAKGVKTIALRLGISVTKSTFKETSNGKGYYFTAKAINLVTKQKATDHCFQSNTVLYGKNKGKFDEDALAKGATRVVRRARRQLIPEEIIDQAVEYSLIGKNTPDALGTAKKEAETARNSVNLKLKQMGITAKQCYDDAQDQMGTAENWGAAEWYALRDKYLDPEVEFDHLKREAKQTADIKKAVEPEPAPEITDRNKAIDDVVKLTMTIKEKHEPLAIVIFDEEGKLYEKYYKHWFNTDAKNMDVGQIGQLAEKLKDMIDGKLGHLPTDDMKTVLELQKNPPQKPVEVKGENELTEEQAAAIQNIPPWQRTNEAVEEAIKTVAIGETIKNIDGFYDGFSNLAGAVFSSD